MTNANAKLQSKKYHARLWLDEHQIWNANIEEIPEVHTFGRTLGKAREYIADALALWLNVPIEEVTRKIEFRAPELPSRALRAIDEAVNARQKSALMAQLALEKMSDAALALTNQCHLSMRDAAELLGLSHQRIQQIVKSRRP
jgi:predicted RNase H-like HicB family nuclease